MRPSFSSNLASSDNNFEYQNSEMLFPNQRLYNVFVGDLLSDVTEEDLREAFSLCGPIHSVHVVRDRNSGEQKGFGFIHFETKEGQMNALSDQFCHTNIKGRPCRTSMSDGKNTLFIGNLPTELNEQEVKELLTNLCGHIVNVELKTGPPPQFQSRGFCFAVFDSHQSADRARKPLSTANVLGRVLNVSWADNQRIVPEEIMSKVKTLYVSNISTVVHDDTLRQLFSQYGEVVNCVIVKDQETKESRGFAFVAFKERSQTEAALNLNGYKLAGQRISVELAKPPPPEKQRGKGFPNEQSDNKQFGGSNFQTNQPQRRGGGGGHNTRGNMFQNRPGPKDQRLQNTADSSQEGFRKMGRGPQQNHSDTSYGSQETKDPKGAQMAYDARTGKYYNLDVAQWEHIRSSSGKGSPSPSNLSSNHNSLYQNEQNSFGDQSYGNTHPHNIDSDNSSFGKMNRREPFRSNNRSEPNNPPSINSSTSFSNTNYSMNNSYFQSNETSMTNQNLSNPVPKKSYQTPQDPRKYAAEANTSFYNQPLPTQKFVPNERPVDNTPNDLYLSQQLQQLQQLQRQIELSAQLTQLDPQLPLSSLGNISGIGQMENLSSQTINNTAQNEPNVYLKNLQTVSRGLSSAAAGLGTNDTQHGQTHRYRPY